MNNFKTKDRKPFQVTFFLSFTALPPLKESRKPPEIAKPFKPSSPAKEVRGRKTKYH